MGEQWPSMKGRKLTAIITRLCGQPIRQAGSHRIFVSPITGEQFLYAVHDSKDVSGGLVRRILVSEIGLDPKRARREAR